MKIAKRFLGAAALVVLGGAAQAATISLSGGTSLSFASYGAKYNPSGTAAGLTEDLTVFDGDDPAPGIMLSGPATITVEFLGKEARALATAFSGGSSIDSKTGGSYTTAVAGGPLDFSFSSAIGTLAGNAGGFLGTAAIAFSQVYGNVIYAFFDDSGKKNDRDFDDMVVKITIASLAEVPVPASAALLGAGLFGLGAFGRRRRRA